MSLEANALPILELTGLTKAFHSRGQGPMVAVNNVSLQIGRGETLALIGESGSGKSTLARLALGLLQPDAGEVRLDGQRLTGMPNRRLRRAARGMQPIFQDPGASLNPRRTTSGTLRQALRLAGHPRSSRADQAIALLDSVGLKPAERYLSRLPHELSGGQRQRLAIARALAVDPELIIADEPLSGTDVSIRGQILNLLTDLQTQRQVSYLFISHDVSVARAFAHQVAVMYRGQIVESGPAEEVLDRPKHPYTQLLLASVPTIERAIAGGPAGRQGATG